MTSSVWECLWSRITQSQQLRRKISAWSIMHIQLGLLCSASKLNFATWAWIGHFFHKQGGEGQRLGWIAEGRAQVSWAGSPCTMRGVRRDRRVITACVRATRPAAATSSRRPALRLKAARAVGWPLPSHRSCPPRWVPGCDAPSFSPSSAAALHPGQLPVHLSPEIGWNRGDPPAANLMPVLIFWRKTQLQNKHDVSSCNTL